MENYQILVYLDEGVDPHSFRLIVRGVRHAFPDFFVRSINRHHFLTENWEAKTKLVIFPGGRDIPYHNALKGEANLRLRRFVEEGGRYLGICAGAYYGCASIAFEEGGELEVIADRELSFFPGVARGPIYGNGEFCYKSVKKTRLAPVKWKEGVAPIFFYGGCSFFEGEGEVLATYEEIEGNPPAAVRCAIGKGKALLTGVHPEYDHKALPNHLSDAFHAEKREAFWHYLLDAIMSE